MALTEEVTRSSSCLCLCFPDLNQNCVSLVLHLEKDLKQQVIVQL